MNRQYHAPSRRQGGDNPYGVGVISVGSTYYLQEDHYWRDRFRGRPLLRNPWIVEAFLNGIFGAARRNPTTGKWESRFISGRSDMAIVRSLRDGRRKTIAVRRLSVEPSKRAAGKANSGTPWPPEIMHEQERMRPWRFWLRSRERAPSPRMQGTVAR